MEIKTKKNIFWKYLLSIITIVSIQSFHYEKTKGIYANEHEIRKITDEKLVINYIKKEKKLPKYYITKKEAKKIGWIPSKGNNCKTIPNKAIGGDRYYNREAKLPKNTIYYEADVNVTCGYRNADRVIFTKKGEVWLTKDHYKTFNKQ